MCGQLTETMSIRASIWSSEFPIGRLQRLLDVGGQAPAVVIVDRQAEGAGAPGERLADPPHAENTQALAGDPPPEHSNTMSRSNRT